MPLSGSGHLKWLLGEISGKEKAPLRRQHKLPCQWIYLLSFTPECPMRILSVTYLNSSLAVNIRKLSTLKSVWSKPSFNTSILRVNSYLPGCFPKGVNIWFAVDNNDLLVDTPTRQNALDGMHQPEGRRRCSSQRSPCSSRKAAVACAAFTGYMLPEWTCHKKKKNNKYASRNTRLTNGNWHSDILLKHGLLRI